MVRTASVPRMIFIGLFTVAAALGLFLMPVGAAPPRQAPYPAPCPCVVVVSAGEAAPSTGACIPIVCGVTNAEGAPAVGVECTMSILSQPGTDATLTSASAMTNEKGEATAELCVGSAPGSVVVLAESGCCQGQVQVTAQSPTAVAPAERTPAALPATGTGTGGSDSWFSPLIAVWGAIALAAGAVLVWRIDSRRRRSS